MGEFNPIHDIWSEYGLYLLKVVILFGLQSMRIIDDEEIELTCWTPNMG
jgi:hypothetical protein